MGKKVRMSFSWPHLWAKKEKWGGRDWCGILLRTCFGSDMDIFPEAFLEGVARLGLAGGAEGLALLEELRLLQAPFDILAMF